ncbi:MAG: MFS transporter [Acidobacteria bacterium]|nr:MFS transporter [Acidobacteriota bacterium]
MTETTKGRVGHLRWVICSLIFLATTINYIDRQILALIKELLDKELGWSNEQFGLVNSAFQGAYAVGLFVFGWFIDRYGTKIGYAVSIALWSVAAMSHALVASVGGFFSARVFLGVSEGGNFPAAIKAVALWFPKRERALATAIFNSGTNVGAIVAPALVPAIAFSLGWRWAFIFAGIMGFLWMLLWIPFYDVPEKRARLSKAELDYINSDRDESGSGSVPIGWRRALGYRQTWAFIVAKFMTDPVWWFFLIWLPDYFKATRGLDIKHSWVHLVTIYVIVTILSIAGGWLTGQLQNMGWSVTRARKSGMFLFALCVLPILRVTQVGDWPAVLLIGLAGAAHQAWSANLFTTASDTFPKKDVGTIVGLGGMAGSIGGILFPWFSGKLLDQYKLAGNVTGGYAILFAICASAYLSSFVVHHLLAPKLEPVSFDDRPARGI